MSTEASFTNLRVVRETDETRPCRLYIRSGSRNIFGSVNDDPETVAFMHLIAAAPEMLGALKDAIEVLAGIADDDALEYSVALAVQFAIAKAEGRAEA
jgi:hypothetical protein